MNTCPNSISAFVDISQEPVLMDEAEAEERRKQYAKDIGIIGHSFDHLASCPAFVDNNAMNLVDILSQVAISYDMHQKVSFSPFRWNFSSALKQDIVVCHGSVRSRVLKSSSIAASETSLVVTIEPL